MFLSVQVLRYWFIFELFDLLFDFVHVLCVIVDFFLWNAVDTKVNLRRLNDPICRWCWLPSAGWTRSHIVSLVPAFISITWQHKFPGAGATLRRLWLRLLSLHGAAAESMCFWELLLLLASVSGFFGTWFDFRSRQQLCQYIDMALIDENNGIWFCLPQLQSKILCPWQFYQCTAFSSFLQGLW